MRLSLEELSEVLALAEDNLFEDVAVAPGKTIALRGATPAEYLTCVVRRVPAERAKFLGSVKAGIEEAEAKDAAEKPAKGKGKAKTVEVEADPQFDFLAYVEAQLDSGPEGMAALVAACAGFGGNEGAEAMFVRHPMLVDLHAVADRLTRGSTKVSHDAFSEAVGALVWGAPTKPTPGQSSPATEGNQPLDAAQS